MHRASIGIHRSVEIAGVLQIESQIDMDFGNVRLRLDATAIRLDRAWRVAQVFADQSKREPSAAVARQKSYGSFKLDAGQLQCARLTQARSNRHSGFGKVGRRSKRRRKATIASRRRLIVWSAAPSLA